jgi:hypothetical protein
VADDVRDPESRAVLFKMAEVWLNLADKSRAREKCRRIPVLRDADARRLSTDVRLCNRPAQRCPEKKNTRRSGHRRLCAKEGVPQELGNRSYLRSTIQVRSKVSSISDFTSADRDWNTVCQMRARPAVQPLRASTLHYIACH